MTIQESLAQFISKELLSGESVQSDANLLADGVVDSIGIMRLVSFIAEEYSIDVPVEHVTVENFVTIDAMASYIQGRSGS